MNWRAVKRPNGRSAILEFKRAAAAAVKLEKDRFHFLETILFCRRGKFRLIKASA